MTTGTTSPPQTSVRTRAPRRRWWFRPLAIALGLLVFAAVEGLLALFHVGRPSDYEDPFVGFSDVRPLFVLNDTKVRYQIPEVRREYFSDESFPANKPNGEFRVFCFGESTTLGHPYSKETSFTTWLELSLQTADPSHTWDVVNCGGVSYASYRLAPIVRECLDYQPDLFVICVGHNEFLEDRSYPQIKHAPRWLTSLHEGVSQLRTYNLIRAGAVGALRATGQIDDRNRSVLKTEVDAYLDYRDGLDAYHRDDAWRAGIVAHYEQNIRGMVRMAQGARVPVILILPPSNLSASPPFKSEHRADLTPADLDRWESLAAEARSLFSTDLNKSIELLNAALKIDDQFALLHYELGKCYETKENWAKARESFLNARELDICPLRTIAPLESALRRVAADTGVPLIDAHALLEARSPQGILGDNYLVDHVHPSIEGHQYIAEAIFDRMQRRGWVHPIPGWSKQLPLVYERHMQSLGEMYYERGQLRLENLRLWAKGRIDGPQWKGDRSSN